MSRTHRASVTAAFTYMRFGLSIVVGIALVPFVLHRVGAGLYGFWLASGEILSYAAMADLGILGIVPWLVAQADGRGDREEIRRILTAGFSAALIVSVLYTGIVLTLWLLLPGVLHLSPSDRDAVAGPLAFIACVTAVVLPLRVVNAALGGLQDVRFMGTLAASTWALDVVITVVMLLQGHKLWALAVGASVPPFLAVIVATIRLRRIAPDLVRGIHRPARADVARLFREGFAGWLGGWGWRLAAATDAIVIASLGHPVWITVLAMTSKLGHMLMQMSWVPGDSGLVGLAQLSGEGHRERLQAAVSAVLCLYVALAAGAACVLLAANQPFVAGWVGGQFFAGFAVNGVLAALILVASAVHALATVTSVLGKRLRVGVIMLVSGVLQVMLALVLGRRYGLIGIPVAALITQALFAVPLLLAPLAALTGLTPRALVPAVAGPWARYSLPMLAVCAAAGIVVRDVPLWAAIPLGVIAAGTYVVIARRLIFAYAPIADMFRTRLAGLRPTAMLAWARAARPPAQ